ncbi:MFS general substrate transporter [Setomelanomma holmii]|uniref:MFS general substrate transporter n=1 Tax=Setomelanomma holmii TaxID=210430 RepID=A0A9P4H051_9PLEO|nr:MFS general substrate transporter [Setomelanomma holmii]
MWSFVQKRQIRKEVERNWRNRAVPLQKQISARTSRDVETGQQIQDATLTFSNSDPVEEDETANHRSQKDEPSLVECSSSSDPLHPQNWPLARRTTTMLVLSGLVFTQAWAGSSEALAHNKAKAQYEVCTVAANLTTAVYLFGIGSGCLLVGPLSETAGRLSVYLAFSFAYLFFVLGSALSNSFVSQIVCRYFVGLACSATLGINGASVGDMFRPVERAAWYPVIAWVNVVPPVIAPIVGGWVANQQNLDWRWTEWITLIISAFAFLVALLFLPETYLPVLLDWKAKSLRQVSGDNRYISEHAKTSSFGERLERNLPLSIRFTTTEPAILALGGFLVLLYILLFSFLSGFDYIFRRTYSLSSFHEGACFASIAIGATTFTLTAPALYAWSKRRTGYDPNAPVVPEFRLWPAIFTAPLLPISLFWLGWTNYAHISIYSGLAACFCFGIVLNAMYVASYQYIIDSYGDHAAIALSSITMMRYVIAGGMVMAARPMYEGIGVHWTMTLLGCIAAILVPGPYLLMRYGQTLRERSRYAVSDVHASADGS